MIVITGATGKLGQLIVEGLLSRLPGSEICVSVRNPEKASALQGLGVRIRRGDFAQPDSLAPAFEGATQLLLISSNAEAFGGDSVAQHRAAIEAAKQAGVKRILYTSHAAASSSSSFPPMRTHAATETMLAESGLTWTALRNGFYADSALLYMGRDWRNGSIKAPADGKVAWTAHRDLAEAAAAILIGTATFDGATPPLTGQEALNLEDLAELGSSLLGRHIERQVLPDSEFRLELEKHNVPLPIVKISLGFFEASRKGEFAAIDPTLEKLIGHPVTTMQQVLENNEKNKSA